MNFFKLRAVPEEGLDYYYLDKKGQCRYSSCPNKLTSRCGLVQTRSVQVILLEQGHVTLWACANEVSAGDLVETRSRHVVVLCKRCQYRVILFEQLLILTTLDPVNTYHSGPCWYLWRWTLLILMTLYPADIYGTGSSWYLWHWTQFILMTLDPVDTYDAGPCWYLWHWTHLILMTLYPPDIYGTGSSWYLRHWTHLILKTLDAVHTYLWHCTSW